jgi:hypothetical protein
MFEHDPWHRERVHGRAILFPRSGLEDLTDDVKIGFHGFLKLIISQYIGKNDNTTGGGVKKNPSKGALETAEPVSRLFDLFPESFFSVENDFTQVFLGLVHLGKVVVDLVLERLDQEHGPVTGHHLF